MARRRFGAEAGPISGLPAQRRVNTPGVPALPLLGMGFCFLLMAALPADTWLRLIGWLAIGLLIYLGYGRHHSVQGRKAG